ncbi:hypothetical protein [Streptomyces sp. BPTC-684]|uniref:DUF6916 family protein n=1 Tax=Streptomyces sp. BPTC-684 TaxID=3043734 RepID=UPI0024B230C0|nr:hypothetical protein [Streptomyces sp. BPTC-684]WHM40898.1 hypothetical protein QIY60_31135 [Streptomyces sp. BPTC-684]
MVVSRRAALLHGAVLGTAFVAPCAFGARRAAAVPARAPAYSLAAWKALVGSTVRVTGRPGSVLRVTEVRDRSDVTRGNRVPGRGEVFVIRLTGQSGPALDEGVHPLEAPALGAPALFLSPVGPGPHYQAVVNTWLPDTAAERR